jgi:alpha-D-xyloside xylohydrolase
MLCKIPTAGIKRDYLEYTIFPFFAFIRLLVHQKRINANFFLFIILFPVFCQGQALKGFIQLHDRINITFHDGTLSIRPLTENAVRIKFYKEIEPNVPELVFTSSVSTPAFQIADLFSTIEIKITNMMIVVDKQTGTISFKDTSGKIFLSEKTGARKLIPDSIMGEPCVVAEQSFESPADEYLFGLGQFQDGHYNLRNVSRKLTQVNSQISIPFLYSSKGYGLLWHQYGLTDFNPADNFVTLEKEEHSIGGNNRVAEVTTTSGTQKVLQNQSLYTGKFRVPENGIYSLFLDLGDMDNRHLVLIDGTPCIDQSNFWLPPTVGTMIKLKAGEHQLQLMCKSTNTPQVSWKRIDNRTTFRSPHAHALDYIVMYGPSADRVNATYRNLSGNVPMLPLWAYGFWQCRERYTSGTNLVETVKEFRKRNFPMDVIVQDWQYWGHNGWGVPQFDEINYSNPTGFIKEIHEMNAHFNISIWSNPDKNSDIGREYVAKNQYIPDSKWLDYFAPLTRNSYWNTLNKNLFSHGVDSWWMDATEPENDALHGLKTYLGPGDFYRLTYPLFVSRAVYEGQRETTSKKRVCILTRSAFLGSQRYSVINWSGDIGGTWDAYKRQIVAGLNYCMSGLPYWTTDIGGFFRPGISQYTDEKYQELLIRWFQWGAFNPIFRVHGYQSETEPWKYGQTVENNIRKMLDLRYRLMPYIYSAAWQITKNGSTLMRPLVMDFNGDTAAVNHQFEYMFGKAFLVVPVIEPDATVWNVYLPKSADWYDFWTGENFNGGQTIKTDASLNKIPLFIKAGSILPFGPMVQYATEKKWDDLEIRVYPGADGEFVLYEDENDNYNYEKGIYSLIKFRWDDVKKTLTIDSRKGIYPGMVKNHTFHILLVNENKGTGIETSSMIDKIVKYTGMKTVLKF